MKTSKAFDFESAIARVPRWMLGLSAAGTVGTMAFGGINIAGGFMLGSLAAYLNFKVIERAVNGLARRSGSGEKNSGSGTGTWVFIQFTGLLLGAFVILKSSGFNLAAAFWGFLVCPAGVVLEIIYELITYDHS